jgi:hypothetical protein
VYRDEIFLQGIGERGRLEKECRETVFFFKRIETKMEQIEEMKDVCCRE